MNTQSLTQVSVTQAENFFRYISELAIKMPALQRPTLEKIQVETLWAHAIEQDISLVEAGFLRLGTVLREDERYPIKGDEYNRRTSVIRDESFGYQHADLLVNQQDEFPEFVEIFKEVYEDEPLVYSRPYMDFLGLVVLDEKGSRAVPRIGVTYNERLFLGWTWLDRGFRIAGRIAVTDQSISIGVG